MTSFIVAIIASFIVLVERNMGLVYGGPVVRFPN
jgi:hypothetical protein